MHWEATYPDATPFLKLTTLTQLSVISRMVCQDHFSSFSALRNSGSVPLVLLVAWVAAPSRTVPPSQWQHALYQFQPTKAVKLQTVWFQHIFRSENWRKHGEEWEDCCADCCGGCCHHLWLSICAAVGCVFPVCIRALRDAATASRNRDYSHHCISSFVLRWWTFYVLHATLIKILYILRTQFEPRPPETLVSIWMSTLGSILVAMALHASWLHTTLYHRFTALYHALPALSWNVLKTFED